MFPRNRMTRPQVGPREFNRPYTDNPSAEGMLGIMAKTGLVRAGIISRQANGAGIAEYHVRRKLWGHVYMHLFIPTYLNWHTCPIYGPWYSTWLPLIE